MRFKIILPNKAGQQGVETKQTDNNMVIVGANGAGKTRFGVWIEQKLQEQITVHRISAQKALNIPDYATIKPLEQAEKELLYGDTSETGISWTKTNRRWGGNPTTFLLNDFDKLLTLLFAKTSERDSVHTKQTRETQTYIPVPDAPIDIIIKIWTELMPHRIISFLDGKVLIKKQGAKNDYHGKEMSDGERVILYLIGQCLCAPDNSIIIIDEPEVHIHRSIVPKLWNKIEELCSNKLLIYITHDLEFAASRTDALKLWIKSYNGNDSWEWDEVPEEEQLPENLLLEIIGNRKNVIFCEGDKGSLDTSVYELVYPNFHIIPRGNGEKVVEATKALRNNQNLHHLNAFGITDSDYKEEEEKAALLANGIHTLSVAEIESLFCIEPILRIIAEHLELNPDEIVEQVIDFLINSLKAEYDVQVSSKAEKLIEYKLGAYSKKSNDEKGLADGLTETLSRIDVSQVYNDCKIIFDRAIANKNLQQLLLIYNRKSLPDRISGLFGLGKGQYGKLLIRLLKGSRQQEITDALKVYLPQLG
ncbi:DUF4435 domain-containing protein [Chitinophaga ginsengisoli]|uniref:Uncharacterized protein DUF4435 n=1 Tax=Chitinophaga ginsengisoli TaxID=363837 RepID=A0A2P8GH22_9BACT|nr:DUF4435 domain-containing protein [Chitinophaga ginsengisoli]PSL33268.1 uncharacterized protein DUF4435 [Chitinophaga ginsengisoli]